MKVDWALKNLGELTAPDSPITYGVIKPGDEGNVPFVRGGDIVDGRVRVTQLRTITSKVSSQYARTLLRGGELLICLVGQPGQVAVAPLSLAGANIARQVGLIRFVENVEAEFVRYYLQSPDGQERLGAQTGGSVQQVINLGDLRSVSIPLPACKEQKRIVRILDEAFDGIATAKANAERNLQNARELFPTQLQRGFSEAYKSNDLVTLADLATDIADGDHSPPPKSSAGIPFITIGNINKKTRRIDFTETYSVARAYFDGLKQNRKPKKGDVLYTVTGSYGIPVLVEDDFEFCFQRHIGLVRPKREIDSTWLYYLLLSPQVFSQASDGATGAAQKTVSLKVLRGLRVPNVPRSQQREMVAQYSSLFVETQHLESIYQQKLAALDELKKSLLHKAFSGEL